jgi:hypothetical protein
MMLIIYLQFNIKKKNFKLDFFYLEKPVCNYELVKFLKIIYLFFLNFYNSFCYVNRIKFIGNTKHNIALTRITGRELRDRDIL